MESVTRLLIAAIIIALVAPSAVGGNREMVEQRVRELGAINRKVVGQLPEKMRKGGRIDIRATVYPHEDTIRIEDKTPQATPVRGGFAGLQTAGDEYVPFKTGFARYLEKPVEIVGLPGPPDNEEYIPFREGIIRMARQAARSQIP